MSTSTDIVQVLHAATASLTRLSPYVEAAVVIPALPRFKHSQSRSGTTDKQSDTSPQDELDPTRSSGDPTTPSNGRGSSAGLRYASISPRGSEMKNDASASVFLVAAHVQAGVFESIGSHGDYSASSPNNSAPNAGASEQKNAARSTQILPSPVPSVLPARGAAVQQGAAAPLVPAPQSGPGKGRQMALPTVTKTNSRSISRNMGQKSVIDNTSAGQSNGAVIQSVFGRMDSPLSGQAQLALSKLIKRDELVLVPPDLEARLLGQLVAAGAAGPLFAMRLSFPKRVTAALVGKGQKAVKDSALYGGVAKRSTSTTSDDDGKSVMLESAAGDAGTKDNNTNRLTIEQRLERRRKRLSLRPTSLVLDKTLSNAMQTALSKVKGRDVAVHDEGDGEDDDGSVLFGQDGTKDLEAHEPMTGLSTEERKPTGSGNPASSSGSDGGIHRPRKSQESAVGIVLVRIRQDIYDKANRQS